MGKGIARYGSASLNDVVEADGSRVSGREHIFAGLLYNPFPSLQTTCTRVVSSRADGV